ncbi:hypothetical protein EJO68_31415 [Variovorax atrisoli]|nr:hypothetical protein EJO68_31415 [Variovorax sp. 369]
MSFPLAGGDTRGPAEPVARCLANGLSRAQGKSIRAARPAPPWRACCSPGRPAARWPRGCRAR